MQHLSNSAKTDELKEMKYYPNGLCPLHLGQSLVEVGNDIVNMLNADAQAHG